MKSNNDFKPLGLFAAFFGMVVAPGETCENLLSRPIPRHFLSIFFLFFVILFTPPVLNLILRDQSIYRPEIMGAILLVFTLTGILFIFFERVLFFIIGVKANIFKVAALVSYSIIPLMIAILVMYFANFAITGDITYMTIIPSGLAAEEPAMDSLIPYILGLGGIFTYFIFFNAIRALENMYFGNAMIISILSIFPLALALVIAIFIANVVSPGSLDTFQMFHYAPEVILNV